MSIIYTPLIGRYLNMFLSLVEDNIKIFKDCRSEFKSMKEIVVGIQDLLKTVDKHRMKTLDHHTNNLRELMYDVEDIIADYSGMEITSRLGIGKKLKDINEKLKEMNSKLENSVNAIVASCLKRKREDDNERHRRCDPINNVSDIVGVDNAVSKIKKWVTKEDRERRVHYNCIGLVGKGGSGKTTLAQMVLKDEEIKKDFHLKMMFVTVSQPVDVKIMMKSMLKELKVRTDDGDDERDMSSKINKYLKKGSRYFLILDDVWSLDDDGWWETIKNALPKGSENCILVTSRMRNIVRKMGVGENQIHEPEVLGEEDGWTLFCKNISTDYNVSENSELKEIGMKIVRKCGGLPLAIKVMGGVVSSCDISTSEWKRIRDNFMERLSNNENDSVMGSLGLSYEELRLTYLQPCLLSFGVFPEDRVIEKDTMLRWWIGEGFVPLTKDGRLSVELAERCFDELVNRSLVEVVERDYNKKVLKCKLHDLVRELLIQKGKSEAFFEIGKEKISRRIFMNHDVSNAYNQISESKNKVRAVVTTSSRYEIGKEFVDKICDVCKYLRVLDLVGYNCDGNVEKLKHLTCLSVSKVPKEICKLKSLLVLRLSSYVEALPSSITKLNQLIWLDCSSLMYFPKGLGNISTLQVLKGFSLSHKGSRFEELRKLTQLVRLEMNIKSPDQLSDGELDALSKLDCLQHLTIHCGHSNEVNLFVQKLDNLVLPKKLDEVKISNYPGDVTPSWICTEVLPYLRYLCFYRGHIQHFNLKFYEGEKWGIIHLKLYCVSMSGDWNVIRGRLPGLKTIQICSSREILMDWENFPYEEIDKYGVWRSTKQRA